MKCTARTTCQHDATLVVEARLGESYRAQAVCDHHASSVVDRITRRVGAPATIRPLDPYPHDWAAAEQLDLLDDDEGR